MAKIKLTKSAVGAAQPQAQAAELVANRRKTVVMGKPSAMQEGTAAT